MDRPFLYVNMAMTADGKITSAGRDYPRFTSPFDRRNMDRLRAQADALLIGAGTLRADNPPLHVRDPEMQAYRVRLGKTAGLIKVVVSASARIDAAASLFAESDGGRRIVATVDDAPEERVAELSARAEVWKLGRARVDLPRLLARLKNEGVGHLLAEGGGELNWDLLQEDLIDELYVTIAPVLLGGREAPTTFEGDGLSMKQQQRLRLLEVEREGDELYCRYRLAR